MKVLLVEPLYNRKYPPLGLMKISTWHKNRGDTVLFHNGIAGIDLDFSPDMIYVTSLFTWDLQIVVQTILSFKKQFPTAEIKVGGVAASAMPKYIKDRTGVVPHIGAIPNIDVVTPDYSLFPKLKESMIFTTRGCPHKCEYCVVRMIEPEYCEIKEWEQAIEPSKPKIVIFDNNVLRATEKHVKHVFDVLKQSKKWVDINSGFDVFLFKKCHAKMLADIKIKPIRFAFDKMSQEKPLVKSIEYCKDAGINLDKLRIYVLFNYTDTVEEARYRADRVIELGCKPFVMNYKPLTWLKKETYVSPHWTRKDITNFTYYYNIPTVWNIMSYDKFISERTDNVFEKMRKKEKKQVLPKNQKVLDLHIKKLTLIN